MSNIEKFKVVKDIITLSEQDFNRAAAPHGEVVFVQEASFAIQILKNNSLLADAAYGDKDSFRNAILNVANTGLSLNPIKKQAYLVPRGKKVCLDISYIGMIHLAISSGNILWVKAEIVYENDEFSYDGMGKEPYHKFNPFGERGKQLGAYCVAKLSSGDYLTEIMTAKEIDSVRNRSSAKNAGPWKSDPNEMIKKTVIRRAYKTWPLTNSSRLDAAMEATQESHELDFSDKIPANKDSSELRELYESVAAKLAFLDKTEDETKAFLERYFKRKITVMDDLSTDEMQKFSAILDQSIERKLEEEKSKATQNSGEQND